MDQQDSFAAEARHNEDGHPLLAMVVALIATVTICSVGSLAAALPAESEARIAYYVGHVAAATLIPWVILFFVSHRRQHPIWAIGSFFLLLVVAATWSLGRLGMEARAADADAIAAAAAFLKASDGKSRVEDLGSPSGPLSEITIAIAGEMIADHQAYLERLKQADLQDVANPQVLARDTSGLNDCARIEKLIPVVDQYQARSEARLVELRARIDKSSALPAMKSGFLAGFDESRARNRTIRQQLFEYERSMVVEWGVICRTLGKRRWEIQGDSFLFDNDTDLDAYQAHINRLQSLESEQQRIQQGQLDAGRKLLDQARGM